MCPQAAPTVFREFYVSPQGADTNPGTASHPFLTLAHARDAVRAVNRGMTGDIVVHLSGGVYRIDTPVEFGEADSGYNGFRVVYRSATNETPMISGGVPVTGWSVDHGQIYRARLNWDHKLRSLYGRFQRPRSMGRIRGEGR
jgi:hypothetical protein